MRPEPPLPIGVDWIPFLNKFAVFFDQPLAPAGPVDFLNWIAWFNNRRFDATAAEVSGNQVLCKRGFAGVPDVRPNQVDFSPPPFDVLSDKGIPAAAFRLLF